MGFNQLCLASDLDAHQQGYLEEIDNASHSLLSLVNEILDFSKRASGEFKLEQTRLDIPNLINELEIQFNPIAQQKNLLFKAINPNQIETGSFS